MPFETVSRRSLLSGGAAAAAAVAAVASGLPRTAAAAAPPAGAQAPGFYRLRVGGLEVTALLDGHLDLPPSMFSLPPDEAAALLRADFRPDDGPIRTPVNAFAVNTGERLYLVDAGTAPGFAPGLSLLPEALAAAGLDPARVDMVVLTHLHVDHAGGLVRDGEPMFPNAQVVVADAEAAFWLDEATEAQAPDEAKPYFAIAQASLAPYGDQVTRLSPGAAGGRPRAARSRRCRATRRATPATSWARARTGSGCGATSSTRPRCSSPGPTPRSPSTSTRPGRRRRAGWRSTAPPATGCSWPARTCCSRASGTWLAGPGGLPLRPQGTAAAS